MHKPTYVKYYETQEKPPYLIQTYKMQTITPITSPNKYLHKKQTPHTPNKKYTMANETTPDAPLPLMDGPLAHPPLLLLNTNTALTTDKAPEKIKKKKLHLPHSCSLDVLPSPTDKWSATAHPTKAWVAGYLGYHIPYKHFFFHQSRVLLTKVFATSTTASTIGNGSTPQGSTELDAICGSNCHMDIEEFHMFA